jgi:hypothetical protein
MATSKNTYDSTREPEANEMQQQQQQVRIFDDGSQSYRLLYHELRGNDLIKLSSVKVDSPDPSDIIGNYIHSLPMTTRMSVAPKTLYFHFTKDDFSKYDIDTQRNQIARIYPNFIIFWAFEFMTQDIVEFRYKQLELLG